MRTIDADKLRAWFESHSVWDEFTVGYIMGLIDEQPSVEAIPIEWIEKYIDENQLYQADDFHWYMRDMIHDWKAERKDE